MAKKQSNQEPLAKAEFSEFRVSFDELKSTVSELRSTFKTEIQRLDGRIDRVDVKVENIAVALLKTQDDVRLIKETMFTKADGSLILDRIDHFAKRIDVYRDQNPGPCYGTVPSRSIIKIIDGTVLVLRKIIEPVRR